MKNAFLSFLLLFLPLVPSCGIEGEVIIPIDYHSASIEVRITDGFGHAYQGVEVRLITCWSEWSNKWVQACGSCSLRRSGAFGSVFFGANELARAGLGFVEAPAGYAALSSDLFEDEATVRLKVGAPALGYVLVDVPLSYLDSNKLVEIEF
jgi:hypothetical protein